ncbi:MAG: SCP2 sterol-binding domain-containing protein [Candidatus Bathyarchaeia archaeon]
MGIYELLKEIFEDKGNNSEEVKVWLEDFDRVFQIDITNGETYCLKINDTKLSVSKGIRESPDFKFRVHPSTLEGVLKGEIDPVEAFKAGRITFKGDLSDAVQLVLITEKALGKSLYL